MCEAAAAARLVGMTSEQLAPVARVGFSDPLLEREVAELMTPGCVVISENATVADAAKAMSS